MIVETSIKVNDLKAKIEEAGEDAEFELEELLREIARYAIRISPVDTGAFVESWSFNKSTTPRRGFRSDMRLPASLNKKLAMKATALRKLDMDVSLQVVEESFDQRTRFYFVNGAPHASTVDLRQAIVARILNRFRG